MTEKQIIQFQIDNYDAMIKLQESKNERHLANGDTKALHSGFELIHDFKVARDALISVLRLIEVA